METIDIAKQLLEGKGCNSCWFISYNNIKLNEELERGIRNHIIVCLKTGKIKTITCEEWKDRNIR